MLTEIILFTLLRAQSGVVNQPWEVPGIEVDDHAPQVFVPSPKQRHVCSRPGAVCLAPGGSGTSEGVEVRPGAAPITVLARGAQVAAVGALHSADAHQPWQVEMVADFARPSTEGRITVAIMDGEDPEAMADHFALSIWDVDMSPGRHLGLRFELSPEQGFQPSHSYLLRVVQRQGKSEKILAEGEFHLE